MATQKPTSIKQLLPDIIWLILDYIDEDNFSVAPCATISSVWQHSVESCAFSSIHLKSTSEVSEFRDAFATTHRRAYLRELILKLHLLSNCRRKQGRIKNQLVFRQAVKLLLDVLSEWENIDGRGNGKLSVIIEPVYDRYHVYDKEYNKRSLREVTFGPSKALLDRKFLALWTEGEPVMLPEIPCVTGFVTINSADFVRNYCDPAPNYRNLRQEHRTAFARGLDSLCGHLPRLKELTIRCFPEKNHPIRDHSFRCQDFTDSQGVDLLCEAIRKLAQPTVTHLTLDGGMVSSDLFHSQRTGSPDAQGDAWHSLQQLDVIAEWVSPNGSWYITGLKESSEANQSATAQIESVPYIKGAPIDEWDSGGQMNASLNGQLGNYWRDKLDSATVEPLLSAWADTLVHRMPCLQVGTLRMPGFPDPASFFAGCAEAGQQFPTDQWGGDVPARSPRRHWCIKWSNVKELLVGTELQRKWKAWVGFLALTTVLNSQRSYGSLPRSYGSRSDFIPSGLANSSASVAIPDGKSNGVRRYRRFVPDWARKQWRRLRPLKPQPKPLWWLRMQHNLVLSPLHRLPEEIMLEVCRDLDGFDIYIMQFEEPFRSSAVQPSATCLLPEVIKLPVHLEGTATQDALCVQWTIPLRVKAKAAVAAGMTTLYYSICQRESHGAEKIEEALSQAAEAGYNNLLCPHISFDDLLVFHDFVRAAYGAARDFEDGYTWKSELDPTEGFVQRYNDPHALTDWFHGMCRVLRVSLERRRTGPFTSTAAEIVRAGPDRPVVHHARRLATDAKPSVVRADDRCGPAAHNLLSRQALRQWQVVGHAPKTLGHYYGAFQGEKVDTITI
ncbi:hypothetical protein PG997_000564 [Apiospora hydei]|uniref:F-box domain-containing protein n=1 Tax=Apiospora hydei TaxID=1337664 RepID=A0ABR1XB43_9PEZI